MIEMQLYQYLYIDNKVTKAGNRMIIMKSRIVFGTSPYIVS